MPHKTITPLALEHAGKWIPELQNIFQNIMQWEKNTVASWKMVTKTPHLLGGYPRGEQHPTRDDKFKLNDNNGLWQEPTFIHSI